MIFGLFLKLLVFFILISSTLCGRDEGKIEYETSQSTNCIMASKPLFKDSNISLRVSCDAHTEFVIVRALLEESPCYENFHSSSTQLTCLKITTTLNENANSVRLKRFNCSADLAKVTLLTTKTDGNFNFLMEVNTSKSDVKAQLFIEMTGPHGGYLSADKWPLLRFYGIMCIVYGLYALVWFIVSFLQWRDLLRIQFWIGAVILIGMIEKAMFYEEYHSVDTTGESSLLGTVFVAELISAAKRSLARMLVIIVSLGYGIVKPRLGSHLPRILIVGILYFILASTEAYFRVVQPGIRTSSLLVSGILLALLDSFISWWIFSSLLQTTRTLRLRRNVVKLQLYSSFTNTLIFAVIASTIFMLYAIKAHRITTCLEDWKDLWMDDAFWHSLFSIILLVIMILWRPTNNNQRYAFSPLLDAVDDYDDDDEIEHFVNDNYGVKMRGVGSSRSESPRLKNNADDDLKWVEENIPPSFIDSTLPILDSDEEFINTKFEMSKME